MLIKWLKLGKEIIHIKEVIAVTCQQVPLTIQNQTINLIAVECLQSRQNEN